MPEAKRKAAPTMVSPSSKKTKKAVEEPPTPLRRSARSAPSKSSITSEIKSPVAPKAKATKKNADKEKPSSSANGIEEKPLEEKSAPRKRAADFYSGDEGEESDGGWDKLHAEEAKASGRKGPAGKKAAAGKKEKLVKKAKVDAVAVGSEKDDAKRTVEQNQERSMPKKSKKAKGPASDDEISLHSDSEPEATDVNGQKSDSEQDEEDEVLDDQTATLLKGFESSDDEDEDEPVDVALAAVKNKEFRNLTIPDVKQKIAARSKKKATSNTPGYIYLGRIPHGFYEHEMRAYFSQFGTIQRLRLSRNKKTGRSKHYAFIEFADSEAASIVAETMDNYLLFGHILKCKVIPRTEIKDVEALFKGANKRFKRIPWGDVKQRELEKKRTEEEWRKLEEREEKRRKQREDKLKMMGIEYEYVPVMQVDSVVPVVEETLAQAPQAIKAAPEVEAEKKAETMDTKKRGAKREKKGKVEKPVAVITEKEQEPEKETLIPKEKATAAPKKGAKKAKGKK